MRLERVKGTSGGSKQVETYRNSLLYVFDVPQNVPPFLSSPFPSRHGKFRHNPRKDEHRRRMFLKEQARRITCDIVQHNGADNENVHSLITLFPMLFVCSPCKKEETYAQGHEAAQSHRNNGTCQNNYLQKNFRQYISGTDFTWREGRRLVRNRHSKLDSGKDHAVGKDGEVRFRRALTGKKAIDAEYSYNSIKSGAFS